MVLRQAARRHGQGRSCCLRRLHGWPEVYAPRATLLVRHQLFHPKEIDVTDEQIKHMVNRFLGWRLPENFQPDAGISFNPEYNVEYNAARGKPPARHQPSGTNLFDATQAEAMIRYIVEGMPT